MPSLVVTIEPCHDSHTIYTANRSTMNLPVVTIHVDGVRQGYRIEASDQLSPILDLNILLAWMVEKLRIHHRMLVQSGSEAAKAHIPSGWAGCEVCRYIAPEVYFETEDFEQTSILGCPNCRQHGDLTFAIRRADWRGF